MKNFLFIIAFLCSIFSWGQILTFEFAGLAGDEVSANSNFNNANLGSSTITRGAGLTASGNADRFNATNWALTSIANAVSGNNYMQFSVTPNSGFQFSVSSIKINLQRSGTGPSAIVLRSSVDGYTTNLDTQYSIIDNTSTQSFTFTFAQANSSSAVTYRVYMYAEATGGSGGIGDFTGNDLVVNGTVTSLTPIPEINVQGLGVAILDGDVTPAIADDTDYGTVFTSTNTTHTFTIQNLGTLPLILPTNPVTLSNTTNGFSVVQPLLLIVPPGLSTTFTVTFNSAVAGTFPNTISIASNDSDENPYDYAITATAIVPTPEMNIAKDMTSSDIPSGSTASTGYNTIFAITNIGNNVVKTYYIENEGTANLTIGTVTITGANPGDFSISAIPSTITVGSTLASSIPFTITFTPQASGVRTATISIVNNDSNENPYTFDVQGTGNCPSYTTTMSPTSGPVGTTVYITSTLNLSGTNTVTLNGSALAITVISSTQISVVIPSAAITGNLVVTNSQGCSTTDLFTVIKNVTGSCEGGASAASELFISEVTDSNTGGLSYIEIYNATGVTKNLSMYSIQIYNNGGSTAGTTISLPSFSLTNGTTYVVAVGTGNPICAGITGSDASLAATTSGAGGINFTVTENDHIKLFNGATELDRWGTYLSNNWADALGLGTEGANFKRKSTATAPSLTYNNADWDFLNWATCTNNDYSGIGSHSYSTGVPPTVNTQPTYTPNCGSVVLATTATEGFAGGLSLAYQWYVNVPGSSSWTALTNTGVYTGTASATLSISSTSGLNNYQYYCQVRENSITCFTATNAVKIKDDITTWNGTTWTYGAPTLGRKAILNGNYTTGTNGNFECCTLEVNATRTLTVSGGGYVVIDFNIINNGNIIVENNGSIVQIKETDTNSGTYTGTKFQVNRTAQARNLDYIYWSSPIQSFLVSSLPGSNRYEWNPTAINANSTQGNWLAASGTMFTAKGYIARASNGATTATALPITFQGSGPNNGIVSVGIARGDTTGTDDTWNLIGNPYPSAMSANSFVTDNTNIEGSVRLWTHGTLPNNTNPNPFYQSFAYNYTDNDYIVSNGTGSTVPGAFDGNIASGQGFFVRMLEDGEIDGTPPTNTITFGSSNVIFKNSHRRTAGGIVYDNSAFFKNSDPTNSIEKSRIWLDLIASNNELSRTLIGYVPDATLAKDRMFDALIEVDAFKLYTLINTQKQAIQGRPVPFDANDLVPMGIFAETAGNYTIAIASVDGLFSNLSQNIYVEDKLLNLIHDLRQAPYTFTTSAGEFNERFVLRYTNTVLSNESFENPNGLVIVSNNKVSLFASQSIKSVLVFDILGRKIYENNKVNSTEVVLEKLIQTKEALIVKTTFEDGKVVTKKIIY
ncbi:choice-of-anchor D domain-containing protein [Flavobacterium gelidilacus]|uniref:choice-of-anchor D domain-containing protein n=1 Tax=Flavobacterium gelidilacus TaxID=206041 RepID=UPI00041E2E65|nr:choice-of-anchor D domain-containing protein [Flavobacterium gelidilacus]